MIDEDLQYAVELWNARGCVERVLARSALVTIGRGAFEAAVAEFPQKEITLRQRTRVIREHRGRPLAPST